MSSVPDHSGGTVVAAFIRELPAFTQEIGLDIAPFAKAVDLDPADFARLSERISLEAVCRLLSSLAAVTGREDFGIQFGQYRTGGSSSAFGQGFVSAPTIKHMVLFYTEFIGTVVDHRFFDVQLDRAEVTVAWDYSPLIARSAEFVDAALVSFIKVLAAATDGRQRYHSFRFRRPKPQSTKAFRAFYPAPMSFGEGLNQVVLSASELSATNPFANEVLYELMCEDCARQLSQAREAKALSIKLKEEIMEALGDRRFTIDLAAKRLGLSVRTLQRRLTQEQLTFDGLVDDARFRVIETKLRDTSAPLSEVAYAAGYSDPSSFTRAVIKRYGQTPTELRKRLRSV